MKWDIQKGRRLVARNEKHVTKEELIEAAMDYYDRGWWVAAFDADDKGFGDWMDNRSTKRQLEIAINSNRATQIAVINCCSMIWVETTRLMRESLDLSTIDGLFDADKTPTWQDADGVHRIFVHPFPPKVGRYAVALPPSFGGFWLPGLSPDDVEVAQLPKEYALEQLRNSKQMIEIAKRNGYKV